MILGSKPGFRSASVIQGDFSRPRRPLGPRAQLTSGRTPSVTTRRRRFQWFSALGCALAVLAILSPSHGWAQSATAAGPAPSPTQDPTMGSSFTRPGGPEVDPRTRTLARDLATQGTRAFEAEDWETALDRFERALALFPAPSIALMKTRCLVRLGRLVEAVTRYEEIQHMPLAADASKPFRQAIIDARLESEQILASIPRIRIQVHVPKGGTEGLVVRIDGTTMPSVLLGVEHPIDPGAHQIEASLPGFRSESKQVVVATGQHAEVTLELAGASSAKKGASMPSTNPSSTDSDAPESRRSVPILGWTLVGIGAVGLGVSAATGVTALQKKSSLDAMCTPACPPHLADDLDAFRTNRTLSYVGLGVGVVSAAIGGYLLWRNAGNTPRLTAIVGPGAVGLQGMF